MNQFNLITTMNSVEPNYDVSSEEIHFEIYVSVEQEVCIVGKIDNNYICWCSITKATKQDTNTEIFNYLLSHLDERLYSTKYKALASRYEEIMKWHFFTVRKEWYKDHFRYRSPVSHCFLGSPPHNNGIFLASETRSFFRNEHKKCQYRLVDNVYVNILTSYKNLLLKNSSPEYYHQMMPIIEILEKEKYLKLCPDEIVRVLYWECLDQCSKLYNSYMDVSR